MACLSLAGVVHLKRIMSCFTSTPLLLKAEVQSISAVNTFANNFANNRTCPSCIGKLVEVKSVERLFLPCTRFPATLRSLSLVYHARCGKVNLYKKASG